MEKSGKIRTFEDLDVWRIGRDLTLKIYEITGRFPKEETYGITSQVRRAALSVPANAHSSDFGQLIRAIPAAESNCRQLFSFPLFP